MKMKVVIYIITCLIIMFLSAIAYCSCILAGRTDDELETKVLEETEENKK